MSFKTFLKLSVAASIASTAYAIPAVAQEVDEEARLAPVVTTAQRIEENVQDVPISITTVADEKLDNLKAGGADIRFLSARVPSVIAESSFGRAFPRFYIRGIGNTDFDLNASQPVSLVYDDVPYENPILKGYPVFDLEGIEVLRGPQGTLFGRNTPGGIIKFDSVKPGDDSNGYIRASVGSYGTKEAEGAFGSRLSDDFAFRVSGLWRERDGFVDNVFTGEDDRYEGFEEYAGRVQLLWSPFEDTDVLLNLHARSNDSDARLFRANIIDPGQKGLGSSFDFETVAFDGDNFLTQDAAGITLRVDREINDALDLTYIFGRETAEVSSRGDIDGGVISPNDFSGAGVPGDKFFPFDGVDDGFSFPGFIPFASESSGAVDDLTQTTHELRFAYDAGGKATWQAGVFVFDEVVNITSASFDSTAQGNPLNGLATRGQDTKAFAFFGSGSYAVTDKLTLAGGARFTDEKKDFVAERTIGPFGSGTVGPLSESVGDEQLSWDLSATYAISDDVSSYARIARGFRGPSVQGRLVFGDELSNADSETVLSYEAGVKSELLDNRVRLNANVFLYELENQQLTIVGGLDNTVALFNADEGQGYGFEADVEAAPVPNLLLTAGISYNKTEIKDDLLIAPGCGAPCTILDPEVFDTNGNSLGFNISGNSFPNAPEWIGNVTARYAIPFRSGEFFAYTDWAYKGETNFFLYESVEFGEEGYWLGGLRAGWQGDNGIEASVFARNITDELVLEGAIDFNNLTGFVNEPRTYGVEVRYDF